VKRKDDGEVYTDDLEYVVIAMIPTNTLT